MSQTTLLKLDRVQNEPMSVILGTIKDTLTETMRFMLSSHQWKTRQKVEQVKAYFRAVFLKNFFNPQLTPRSRKRRKGMQTGAGQVLDGSNRGLNTASMPADRGQVKQRTQYCKYAS